MTEKFKLPEEVEDGNWYRDARAAVRDASIDNRSGFQEYITAERTNVINISSTYPLSGTREVWENVEDGSSEERLHIDEGTADPSWIRTTERARYIPGYEAQVGVGVRIPNTDIVDDAVMRWGYFENINDTVEDIGSAFYFGVDKNGVFVAKSKTENDSPTRVYQENWNGDRLSGNGGSKNPSGLELDLSVGIVCQIEFIYYGYGATKMQFWVYNSKRRSYEKIVAHVFKFDGEPSLDEVNLPIRAEILSNEPVSTDYDMFIGGRQFSIIGQYTPVTRPASHARTSAVSMDADSWSHAISFRAKDGFENITARLNSVQAFAEDDSRFMVRKRLDEPGDATWNAPSETDPSETAMEVSVDGSFDATTGIKMHEGLLQGGQGNRQAVASGTVDVPIGDREIVSLFLRNIGGTGSSKTSLVRWTEEW